MTWHPIRIIGFVVLLLAFGTAWNWFSDEDAGWRERWQIRVIILAVTLALAGAPLGLYQKAHPTKAQEEAWSELDAP
jgi:hypothetical protein